MKAIEDILDVRAMEQFAQPDDKKLRELILYIAWACESDPTFGATKLNKLLLFSDFRAYVRWGKAITWQDYQRLPNGPAPRRLKPIQSQMQEDGDILIRAAEYFGREQHRTIPLREPDLSLFTAAEIALVAAVIQEWWNKTATQMSEASHELVGWQLASPGETVPYQSALFEKHDPSEEETQRAVKLRALAEEALTELRG